jgi:transposase InsO family protein
MSEVLCIPRIMTKDYSSNQTSSHHTRTLWCPKDSRLCPQMVLVASTRRRGEQIISCGICQANKTNMQRPVGLLHPLPIPKRPWGLIGMDFIGPFPKSKGYDYLWVVICRLTSMVHLTPVKTTIKASKLASLYMKEIVCLHGLPDTIVSDQDLKFTSKFWSEVHRILGTKLLMSTTFHPQTNGASKRVNRSVGQILRTVIQPDQSDWVDQLPMTKFAINSNVSSSTGFAPFELNCGYMPTITGGITPFKNAKPGVKRFINQAINNSEMVHDTIIQSRVSQTQHANRR